MCFIFIGIALIPWLQNQRYEKKIVNMLEGSFILNIIVLIILSIIVTNVSQEDKYRQLIFYISIGIAFIKFLGILAFHIWYRLNLNWMYRKYFKSNRVNILSNTNHQYRSKDKDEGKPGVNDSTTMDFYIRELLLDDTTTEL